MTCKGHLFWKEVLQKLYPAAKVSCVCVKSELSTAIATSSPSVGREQAAPLGGTGIAASPTAFRTAEVC